MVGLSAFSGARRRTKSREGNGVTSLLPPNPLHLAVPRVQVPPPVSNGGVTCSQHPWGLCCLVLCSWLPRGDALEPRIPPLGGWLSHCRDSGSSSLPRKSLSPEAPPGIWTQRSVSSTPLPSGQISRRRRWGVTALAGWMFRDRSPGDNGRDVGKPVFRFRLKESVSINGSQVATERLIRSHEPSL